MATAAILDFERLVAPISPDSPTGQYLKSTQKGLTLFTQFNDALGKARGLARLSLSSADSSSEPPDWKAPVTLAKEILGGHSKDLWVSTGLIESLVRTNGIAGLRDGIRLTRELVEQFWESLHPVVDPADLADGYYTTTDRLRNLDATIPEAILLLNLADSPDHPDLTFFDYVVAGEGRGGDVTIEMLEGAVRGTPPSRLRDLQEDIEGALEELTQLDSAFDQRFEQVENGSELAPSFRKIRKSLEDCRRCLRVLSGQPEQSSQVNEPDAVLVSNNGASSLSTVVPTVATTVSSAIATREDAYRSMEKIAVFFEKTEPHSPIGPALRHLVSWRNMDFGDLMKHLIEDQEALKLLFRRTGVEKSGSDED
ncbi:MAG TPA: type VI secretion system protein TssA [Planctomicrobium sp.]|nr:type VI secretion system protein TssA [Planctomicrobium sp.]